MVRPPLDDLPVLEHEDLVGAADGREPVRDHERRASRPQRPERLPDLAFALGVETRRRLVEDQHLRVGEDRTRDRHALPLPAREFHTALADDRVVAVGEPHDELLAVRDPRRVAHFGHRRARLGERDVLGDRAIKEEVVL